MTVEEFFDQLAECFAVTVDYYDNNTTLCYPQYYCPEDRCGDDTQPMVEMLDSDLCIEPSDVIKIVTTDYMVTVYLKDSAHPYTFQFLNCKKFEADQFDKQQQELLKNGNNN